MILFRRENPSDPNEIIEFRLPEDSPNTVECLIYSGRHVTVAGLGSRMDWISACLRMADLLSDKTFVR